MSPPRASGSPKKASHSVSAAAKSGSPKAEKASLVRAADAKAGATSPSELATAKVPALKAPPLKSPAAKKVTDTGPQSLGKNRLSPTAKKAATGAKTATKNRNAKEAETSGAAAPQLGEEEQARMKAEEERKQAEALAKAGAEMEELRKKAWFAQVEFERQEEAKRRKRAEDEARRKKEEAKLVKDMLEAAFDGEDAVLQTLLERAKALGMKNYVDAADAHGNTILSEAAAGGTLSTVQLLLDSGADPNTRGEFARTPLWRACFLGKAEVVMPLLRAGADPRIGNHQGERPLHAAASAAIKEALQCWDEAETDRILASWQTRKEDAAAAEEAERMATVQTAEVEVATSKTDFDNAQASLKHARCELEKRIFEHDTCVQENKPDDLIKMTLDQIKLSELTVESAKARATEASRRLDAARLALRESVAAATHCDGVDEAPIAGIAVEIRDLDDVLVRDVGEKIKADGRWPLVIDPSGQASVFLRYLVSLQTRLRIFLLQDGAKAAGATCACEL
mmetsp:Transcript_17327/g.52118  ORF Transcript_17327/g.52118 Transcript_17327/m.52118 type:complete len:511 (-) Transcript_17327:11-1543(-)